MGSFDDLPVRFGSIPSGRARTLFAIAEAHGREQMFRRQNPETLASLQRIARVQSAEASNAIEDIHAPHARIEALMAEAVTPANRSEQEIAGYRYVLDQIHASAPDIPFEPRYVQQLHGYLARFTGDRSAGHWKTVENVVEERRSDGSVRVRFYPVLAVDTPAAMERLHRGFTSALRSGEYEPLLLIAAYVLDFLVIHPFLDGNGRMSRLITLWLLYQCDFQVGRYISIERLVQESRSSYYDALARSTVGWHQGEHDLGPFTDYLLGVILAAYRDFEQRTQLVSGRGSKRARIIAFVRSSASAQFTISDLRDACPGISDAYLNKVLAELKAAGTIAPHGRGRGSSWRRL